MLNVLLFIYHLSFLLPSFTGDVEVDRLLNEIDDAAKLLPYLMEKDKAASVSQDIEQAVQPYKVENAQLRRFVCKSYLTVVVERSIFCCIW